MRRANWLGLLVLVCGGLALAEAPPDAGQRRALEGPALHVGLGVVTVLKVPGARRVASGNADLLQSSLQANGVVLLVGVAPGQTTLSIWTRDGERVDHEVTTGHDFGVVPEAVREFRQVLGEADGVTVRLVGRRLVVDGVVSSPDEAERLAQAIALSALDVVNQVKPAAAEQHGAAGATAALARAGFVAARVVLVEQSFVIVGEVGCDEDRERAERVVRAALAGQPKKP